MGGARRATAGQRSSGGNTPGRAMDPVRAAARCARSARGVAEGHAVPGPGSAGMPGPDAARAMTVSADGRARSTACPGPGPWQIEGARAMWQSTSGVGPGGGAGAMTDAPLGNKNTRRPPCAPQVHEAVKNSKRGGGSLPRPGRWPPGSSRQQGTLGPSTTVSCRRGCSRRGAWPRASQPSSISGPRGGVCSTHAAPPHDQVSRLRGRRPRQGRLGRSSP